MDTTVKALLALITLALWGLLLRPFLALPAAPFPAIAEIGTTSSTALVVQGGRVYKLELYPRLRVAESVPLR